MKSIDPYLTRVYDEDRYNCLHLVDEAWRGVVGGDIRDRLNQLLAARAHRRPDWALKRGFRVLPGPVEPCLVVMRRPLVQPHIGLFLRGRVLHINELGVEFQPLEVASRGYKTTRFYQPC